MRILYISPYSIGSTSRMRGKYLEQILNPKEFKVVDTSIPLAQTSRLFRSLGWRYKFGPLIHNINRYISDALKGDYSFDLVWIDKGVFIEPEIVQKLKQYSHKLVHYTPDPAFTFHRSKLFYNALNLYDYCITTKSFEIDNYRAYGVKTIFCTQGYDPLLHKPYYSFDKKKGIVFIGHNEGDREYTIAKLIEQNIQVTIAGNSWGRFARKYSNNKYLIYKGKGIYGEQYAKELSAAAIGLGFLSKWIPELHTTRTIEIPACGTALVSERNAEISSIFSDNDVIFFDRTEDITEKVKYYLSNLEVLKQVTENGHHKIINGGFSYFEIMNRLVQQIK